MGKIKQIKKFLFSTILIFVLIFPSVSSEYYADIEIIVDEAGYVTITGKTNHPDILVENSQMYTYKNQDTWLLNITINDLFSDYIYDLKLPQGSTVNYLNLSGLKEIKTDTGNLLLTGSGGNENLSLIVKYQINSKSIDYNILFILGILIFIVSLLLIYSIIQNKRKKENILQKYNFKGLTERQKQIMQLLIDADRPLTQVEIERELKIPKAAVSRNVHSLELKSLIEIEKSGMSNLIRLKKH
jgi:uncharacterized membrane protein